MEFKMNKLDKNYKKSTFILLGILGVMILAMFVITITSKSGKPFDKNYDSFEQMMCLNIKGTPAWANYNGQITGYGVNNFNEEYQSVDSNLVVENLIKNKIYYLYNPDCIHCQAQAEWFGEEAYSKYKQSGYAVDCTQY